MSNVLKKLSLLVFLGAFLFTSFTASANQVPLEKAKQLAKTAFALKSSYKERSAQSLKITEVHTQMIGDEPAYYIFNMEPKGFIVVSAEDKYNAVLAFSDESQLLLHDDEKMVPVFGTLNNHEQHIAYIKQNEYETPAAIQKEWDVLRAASVEDFSGKNPEGMVVAPLTTTIWNQDQYYNAFTPTDVIDTLAPDGRTFCGCGPIAMAQLIKFHDYPRIGNGNLTYVDPIYDRQSADFCREYNWSNMPDSLTDHNDDVAEFIYHVGVSTQTEFSTVYTNTYISRMRDALVEYWNYHSDARWFFDLNNEFAIAAVADLNQGRPLLVSGSAFNGTTFLGAHTWVADGYGYFLEPQPGQPDIYFHFNFGWGGDNNGWFLDNGATWAPIPFNNVPANTFYWDRFVIHNIYPAENGCSAPSLIDASRIEGELAVVRVNFVGTYDRPVQFRFRKLGTAAWIEMGEIEGFTQVLEGLEELTDYEYQVRQQCCEGAWSEYSSSQYFQTILSPETNPCDNPPEVNLTTSSITKNNSYIYTSRPFGVVENQFRYRFVGSLFWSYTDISTSYFRYLSDLEEGTEYEFQVRHICDANEWTDYSTTEVFRTKGGFSCMQIFNVDLFTSSITENNSYIYTSQPLGQVDNRFRYRVVDATDWIETDINSNYYRYLSGLQAGTDYEFQVSHLCEGSVWQPWSDSHIFRTLGGVSTTECDAIPGSRLYTSSVTSSNAYIYTPQPYGQVGNQFRYRKVGDAAWTNSIVSTQYYRFLSNLEGSSTYEFQVAHECEIGNWSAWSDSGSFTTAAGFAGRSIVGQVLPPIEDPTFHPSMLETIEISVFPNPAVENITLESSQLFLEGSLVRIFDVSGKVVHKMTLPEGQRQQKISVEDLQSGIYVISYDNGFNSKIQRLVKH